MQLIADTHSVFQSLIRVQRFFDFELQLQAIAIDSLALCLYTLLVALGGMYLFTKQDVG